jgi:UDP-N-acetyl-D-mannosaminuronic acid dehydrogenase
MQAQLPFRRISIIGLGYIGLPTAAMFASRKIEVIGVDVNLHSVDTINQGQIHIVEPDLDIVVQAAVSQGYLRATLVPEPADAFLIAVPTPFKSDSHDPDLSYIKSASEAIASVLKSGDLVVLESTSPVGATALMANWLAEARPDLSFPQDAGEASDIRVAYCPERVLPGRVMQELITNDRIIGGMTPRCSRAASRLYKTFVSGDCIIASNPNLAEMAKLTENSFRDVNIAFANELSMICDHLKIDVWELIRLANLHPRVNILQPGPGVGGHCIAVDPWFVVSSAPEQAQLIRNAREVNLCKADYVVERAKHLIDANPDSLIACLGLSFKPNIDDLRESPAIYVAEKLAQSFGSRIHLVEPFVRDLPSVFEGTGANMCDLEKALAQCSVLIVLVDHDPFKSVTLDQRTGKVIYDTRGIWTDKSIADNLDLVSRVQ